MRILFLLIPLLCGCATVDNSKMREDYVVTHPSLSEQTKQDIRSGTYRIGMTKEEVQAVLGMPDIVLQYPESKSCSSLGCIETIKYYRTYFTFFNGKLQSFTDINY